MLELILVALFTVRFVDLDNGQYNVLLEDKATGNMVAHWVKEPGVFKEGATLYLSIKGDCTKVYEVLEGNGKRGSAWAAEDDWYLNRRPYICNAITVEIL